LVSPKNPLKSADSLADYAERIASACTITKHNLQIFVSDIEQKIGTKYSYQTISLLKKRYHGTNFIWLMGADNLAGFHRWQRWKSILQLLPIVVFDRAPYSFTSLASVAAIRMKRFVLKNNVNIKNLKTPTLRFIRLKRDAHSSTDIRSKIGRL
jgi:nicotinate-nucleotide adenylyltransferase